MRLNFFFLEIVSLMQTAAHALLLICVVGGILTPKQKTNQKKKKKRNFQGKESGHFLSGWKGRFKRRNRAALCRNHESKIKPTMRLISIFFYGGLAVAFWKRVIGPGRQLKIALCPVMSGLPHGFGIFTGSGRLRDWPINIVVQVLLKLAWAFWFSKTK